jgi:hypothetical protein
VTEEAAMSRFILPLASVEATLENAGGKGMSLAALTRAGLPVPDGFHVTTEAYRRFASENGLEACIVGALEDVAASDPVALEAVSRRIGHRGPHELEVSAPRPAEDLDWIERQLAGLAQAKEGAEALIARQGSAVLDIAQSGTMRNMG